MKELVREKKLNMWREVVEKANTDFDGNKKEFWAFVGRRTKGKRKKNIPSLKSEGGMSVTSTRGKLYYKGTISNLVSLVWIVILMPSGRKRLRVL